MTTLKKVGWAILAVLVIWAAMQIAGIFTWVATLPFNIGLKALCITAVATVIYIGYLKIRSYFQK